MKIIYTLQIILLLNITTIAQILNAPTGLTCELLREPEHAVITNSTPKFSWIFPQSGIEQKAYRILVASSPFKLKESLNDCWDSGIISQNNSINIKYLGEHLKPNSTYWWQVKVWAINNMESDYSKPQQFNTGDFERNGLEYPGQSRWIELESNNWVSENKQIASFHYFAPSYIHSDDEEKYFAEFEKSVIGTINLTISSEIDSLPVVIKLGERMNEDFSVNQNRGLSNIGYEKVDLFLKKGIQDYVVKLHERKPSNYLHSQKLAPHFPEVMPFRFVEINGNLNLFTIKKIEQAALTYYFDDSASNFTCSNANLKKVWDLCKYTLKATPFLGVYADGNRERMPYEADAYIQQLSHYAVDREFSISRYTLNFLLDHASWPTEWQMHVVLMAWEYYINTGDTSLLIERYEDIKRKTLIALAEDNTLISTRLGKVNREFLDLISFPGPLEQFRDIVDWPHGANKNEKKASNQSPIEGGETDGYIFNDFNAVVNAFHYRSLVLMSRIAKVTCNESDYDFFIKRSEEHKKIFLTTFFDYDSGIFKDGDSTNHSSLHANMFPLAFGLVPTDKISTLVNFIKSRGMACSVYGAQYLLESLFIAGEADYALDLMTSESKRSWINMIKVGSSMTTEAWDEFYKPNLTWNHAWGTAPANIISRKLIGIEPLEPAYSKFKVCPQPGYLDSISLKIPALMGEIECMLNVSADKWLIEISIPGNTEAEIWIPEIFSNTSINNKTTVTDLHADFPGGRRNIFKLKSGIHSIIASNHH